MYCSNCATPLTPGLSYCNRCGNNLKGPGEPTQNSNTGMFGALLTAIVVLGVIGMGIMLGGPLVLRSEAGVSQDFAALFMFFTFTITLVSEIFLLRQLSRLTAGNAKTTKAFTQVAPPRELHAATGSSLGEPVASVTENTTRTLEYAPREQRTS